MYMVKISEWQCEALMHSIKLTIIIFIVKIIIKNMNYYVESTKY